jgi:DNA-binding NarL/FixJ family response regulator
MIIAGSHNDRLASWRQGLSGIASTTLVVSDMDSLRDNIAQIKPKTLLLDFDLLGSHGFANLRCICADTSTIIIGDSISEDVEWDLLKAGIRGCCPGDSPPTFIRQVVETVQEGELWIRRTLSSRLIDELGTATGRYRAYQASLALLNNLTQREFDIAVRVGNGENNKQIAKACAITERTVKAHLTEVFRKLGVTDRLRLALLLSVANEKDSGLEGSDRQSGFDINASP